MDLKLTIELVPSTSWGDNLRSRLTEKQWDFLRKRQYDLANHRCEICNGVGNKHPVECHEIWHYDDEKHIQTLTGLIALCPSCHQVKHMGFAFIRGLQERAIRHMMSVNCMSRQEADRYISSAFSQHKSRSKSSWQLDLSWINSILASSFS